ncbi:MAG: formyltetrahydrofolate deformylase [Gammaproteobacteria bacterium]
MTNTSSAKQYTLTVDCPDRSGVVAAVSTYISRFGGLILEASHFREPVENRSFMRTVFSTSAEETRQTIAAGFAPIAEKFDMTWAIWPREQKCRVLVAVSKQDHCLNSMLHRYRSGTLPIDIVGVVSNHDNNRRLVEWHGLAFHHLPIETGRKRDQEQHILERFSALDAELLVLARYMQILSPEMTAAIAGRCINIHHSFLPGFRGARPYHQAYERGVKLIGATSHYVTADLDEGPIIEQAVERVDHSMDPTRLTEIGNDVESVVLNRAVRWHAEHRLFVRGNRVVVLT